MFALFWRRLPEVSRRRFQGRVLPRFGTRLWIFFVTFFLCFGAYVMAFVTGSDWGVEYGHRCLAFCELLSEKLTELLAKVPVPLVQKVGSGIARLVTNDMAAVITTSFLVAAGLVIVVCAVSLLAAFVRMLCGRDGSQAEVYDGSEKIEGVRNEAQERRRRRAWRPNVANNPYSVTKAKA